MYVMAEAISDLALPPLNGEIGGKRVKVRGNIWHFTGVIHS
jgi:hypothetical protein